jgi:iron complex transport system permease protein
MMRPVPALAIFLAIALLAIVAGLAVGSTVFSPGEYLAALTRRESVAADIIWGLRAPRVYAGFCAGALLAIAGAFLQALLRNPLADPYIFGVSSGAALGVLGAMLLGLGAAAGYAFGLAGAAGVALLVAVLSYRVGDWNPYRLLLTGVIVASGLNALIGMLLVLAPAAAVKGMLFWLMGDLSYSRASLPAAIVLLALVAGGIAAGPAMNALSLGRMKASTLGVATGRLELLLYVGAAVAATTAVLIGGTIGFIGLVVPHLVRLAGIHDHRWLVPCAALSGGSLLVLADTLARSAWAPLQLPVGVLTALIGVPVLLLLLSRRGDAAS